MKINKNTLINSIFYPRKATISMDNKDLLLEISNIAIQAGEEILNYYNQEIEITQKNDSSPLTQADIASNKLILNALYNFHLL